jgi:hypothetical protein
MEHNLFSDVRFHFLKFEILGAVLKIRVMGRVVPLVPSTSVSSRSRRLLLDPDVEGTTVSRILETLAQCHSTTLQKTCISGCPT